MKKLLSKLSMTLLGLYNDGMAVLNQKGAAGAGAITGLFTVGILAFVLYIVVANFWPSAQTANNSIQAATGTDAGTSTSKTFFGMGLFLIPIAIFVSLFIILIKRVSSK